VWRTAATSVARKNGEKSGKKHGLRLVIFEQGRKLGGLATD
jgi:hypothetical protein